MVVRSLRESAGSALEIRTSNRATESAHACQNAGEPSTDCCARARAISNSRRDSSGADVILPQCSIVSRSISANVDGDSFAVELPDIGKLPNNILLGPATRAAARLTNDCNARRRLIMTALLLSRSTPFVILAGRAVQANCWPSCCH